MRVRLLAWALLVAAAAGVTGCGVAGGYNLPPAERLMHPGPGVGGPGPGVLTPEIVEQASFVPDGAIGAIGAGVVSGGDIVASDLAGGMVGPGCATGQKVQVLFGRPEAMQISYDVGGAGGYDSVPIVTPARQNFYQGGIYRLKINGIPGREGVELYPTIEVGIGSRRTAAYLAHNAIPIQFTEEDFDQVLSGNFVTKVIYLPDPDFQELALAGVETLVSTRLDPGLDPIIEADRRGAILAVIRIGNKDMEIPGEQEEILGDGIIHAGAVSPAGFAAPMVEGQVGGPVGMGCPDGDCMGGMSGMGAVRGGYGPGGLPPGLAGAGQYGMPITGTPIGLPGPPHVPLGVPAGLQKHVVRNWTKQHIPDPVSKLKINVRQRPGLSYPQPPNRAWITEDTVHPSVHYSNHHFGTMPTGQHYNQGSQHGGGLLQALKNKF